MTPDDRRIAIRLFVLAFGTYAFFFGGSGFNQNASFDQARALVERGTLAINGYAANTFDISIVEGRIYPNKAPGTTFLAAIPYAIVYPLERAAGWDGSAPPLLTLNLYLVTLVVCAVPGALIPAILYLHLRRREVNARTALATAIVTAFGTPLFAYATMLFLHVPSAAALLIAYDALFRDDPRPLRAGAFAGLAGLTNYLCIPPALILAWRAVYRPGNPATRQPGNLLRYIAAGAPFALALALYQKHAFGKFTELPLASENPAFLDPDLFLGVLRLPSTEALWGITFSPYRGLFFLAPVLLLAVVGLRKLERGEALTIVAIAATFFAFNTTFNGWHGGYAIGPRYLLPMVPLLAIGIAFVPRKLVLAVGALSIALNLVATAVDPQPPDSVRNPLFDYAIPSLVTGRAGEDTPIWIQRLFTGHVATNRVAADEAVPFKRHAPGSPASEWASFNLGETLLPQGHWSTLLPVLAWMALGCVSLSRAAARTR